MSSKLPTEIDQRKAFDSLEQEVFLNLRRTVDVLNRQLEVMFKSVNVSATQYNVLRILRGAGDEGLACGEIGERMISQDPDMTRLLDRLEAQQLITRGRDSADRRIVKTQITASGLALLASLDEPVRRAHKQQFAHMDQRQLAALLELLEIARSAPPPSGDGASG